MAIAGMRSTPPQAARSKEAGGANWIAKDLPELAPGCFGTIVGIADQMRLEDEPTFLTTSRAPFTEANRQTKDSLNKSPAGVRVVGLVIVLSR
jgi:hypothetical protein